MSLWSIADLADALHAGLSHACHAQDLEQAVYGIDCLDELKLHVVIAEAFSSAGYGVFREQRYPAERRKRSRSEGERCDLVLTPDRRALESPDAAGTLFDPADSVALSDAFWMEVKTVAQFSPEGPNPHYSSQLLSTVRQDVTKLSKDPDIHHAGLLLLMFVQDQRVADHDLRIWQDRCLARGLPIAAPSLRSVPLRDRHGNSLCAIALYPVRHL